MNGAQWLVKELIRIGVKKVFGYPGGAIMPFYDALYNTKLKHFLCRHEQGAIMAAIGYARSTKKIGVCIATSGPGATNLITGLADALLDSVPIVAITGQVDSKLIGTDSFQEVDVLGLSLACTKHSFLVNKIEELPIIISRAFYIAEQDRPGPVLIDIPKDIQLKKFNLKPFFFEKKKKVFYFKNELKEAKKTIKKSSKPVLYIGGGVNMSDAVSELRNFLFISEIPVVCTLKGLGSVNKEYPYYLGMLGMHGNKAANFAVQQSDLLIVIGARFDDRVTGNLNEFATDAKIIHIDIDPAELNKLRNADVSLVGDIKLLLPKLVVKLNIKDWQNRIKLLIDQYKWNYSHAGNNIYVPSFLKKVSDIMPKNTIITTDVGQHQMWAAQHIQVSKPENFISSSGLGSMGFGIPAAIGAKLARSDSEVICISGDGSFMMNIQELATIKRYKLSIKIILIDNKRLGMVRQWQELFFKQRYSETILSDNPNFIKLVESFDIIGNYISFKNEIDSALDSLFSCKDSYLLQVSINELENVWPLVPPGLSNEKMIERSL